MAKGSEERTDSARQNAKLANEMSEILLLYVQTLQHIDLRSLVTERVVATKSNFEISKGRKLDATAIDGERAIGLN